MKSCRNWTILGIERKSNWDKDVSPDDWMQQLKDFFNALGDYFQDEQEIADLIDDQLLGIESWIRGHTDMITKGRRG